MKSLHAFCVAIVVVVISRCAIAQPLADRVPADAIVYVGWRGAENVPGYNESHLKAIVDQSNFAAVFNELVPQLIARAAQRDVNAGAAMKDDQKMDKKADKKAAKKKSAKKADKMDKK